MVFVITLKKFPLCLNIPPPQHPLYKSSQTFQWRYHNGGIWNCWWLEIVKRECFKAGGVILIPRKWWKNHLCFFFLFWWKVEKCFPDFVFLVININRESYLWLWRLINLSKGNLLRVYEIFHIPHGPSMTTLSSSQCEKNEYGLGIFFVKIIYFIYVCVCVCMENCFS